MNRYTYSISTILAFLIFLIYGAYAVTKCKCKNNTNGLYCGAELECSFDPNDDPNYGYADIWQCGPATPETNFCWLGPCLNGCCQNNDGKSCCNGGSKCNRCDLLITTKQPGTTTRTYPGKCSSSPMSFPTPADVNPPSPNTSPPNVSPSNTSPSKTSPTNTSPPSTSPIQNKNKAGIIAGSTIGSVLGLIIIITGVIYYIRKVGDNPGDGIVRHGIGDNGDD